jgi:hypothetical protein
MKNKNLRSIDIKSINVKPKFSNVMKQKLFTLIAMFALVIVAGSAMAQSTYNNAYVGASHTYTIDGLQAADGWQYYVLTAGAPSPYGTPTAATSGTDYSFTSGETYDGTGSLTSAVTEIKWLNAGTYYLWLEVQDNATGCSNYRFLTVTVTAYDVAFRALALITGDENTIAIDITGATGSDAATDCPAFLNENFDVDDATTDTEGSTYAYFKVERYIDPTGSGTLSSSNWNFTPTVDTDGSTITSWDYSYDGATWASVTTIGNEFTATYAEASVAGGTGTNNVVYFRATMTNADETEFALGFDIGVNSSSVTAYEVTGHIDDSVNDEDESTLTISPLPTIGGFSGN